MITPPPLGTRGRSRYVKLKTLEDRARWCASGSKRRGGVAVGNDGHKANTAAPHPTSDIWRSIMAMGHVIDLREMTGKVLTQAREEPFPFILFAAAGTPLDGFDLFYPLKDEARKLFPPNTNLPVERLFAHTGSFEIVGPRALKSVTEPSGIIYTAEEIAQIFRTTPGRQLKALGASGGSLLIAAVSRFISRSNGLVVTRTQAPGPRPWPCHYVPSFLASSSASL